MQRLIPQQCLLCGSWLPLEQLGQHPRTVWCAACDHDLPRLPASHCHVCAVPLPSGEICGACLKRPPRFARVSAALVYRYPADALIHAFKYGANLALADPMADLLADVLTDGADIIVPLPLAPNRLRERGFNQAHEIGRRIARRTGIALAGAVCRKVLDTAAQAALPWKERARNVRGAFVCEADLSGLTVAVVDDVMTSGATLNELARTLRRAGASRVIGWVVARAVRRDWLPVLPD
ncbi:MAG: ComF family protein [Betaproteobacteria bacterium]|nr:ComF family protein [Betaproteobacteria bacterium]